MDIERFSRLEDLFQRALGVSADDRDAWIDAHCDPDTASALRLILDAHETIEDDPAHEVVMRAFDQAESIRDRRVGPYRIVAEIGRGGMGTVYKAVRSEVDFEQTVAIKLLRLGLRDSVSMERFKRERQLLAQLSHPNIASLIDGGTTDDGTPWVAMELVQGETLIEYAQANVLDLRQRIALFVKLCRAIGHAHRNLVVHRDLKPENILVNAEGEPKVLDFGIAKLLDDEGDSNATLAQAYTPVYASPEQVMAAPITLACDVYALGVLLFELLTGKLPYVIEGLHHTRMHLVICEQPPLRPSQHSRQLRGDLDHIILKALRKEPQRRYTSANELAEDLERYLASRPVLARPDRHGYRLRKYVQRHPFGIASGTLILALALAFLVNTAIQSTEIRAQRDRALREAAIAQETTDFLVGLFQTADPKEREQVKLSAADLLDHGAQQIATLERTDPLVKSRLMHVMGLAYTNLGRYEEGIDLLNRALVIRQRETGSASTETVDSLNRLGNALRAAGHFKEAESHLVAALQYRVASGELDNEDLADSYNNVGLLQLDLARYAPAAKNLQRAIAMHRGLGGDNSLVAVAMHNLALVRMGQARPAEAIGLLDQAMTIKRDQGLLARSTYANSQAVLARALLHSGRLSEALAMADESLRLRRRILPEFHPQLASGMATRAEVLVAMGEDIQALESYAEILRIAGQGAGSSSWSIVRYQRNQARLWEAQGQVMSALPVYRQVVLAAASRFEEGSLHQTRAAIDLGRALLYLGQTDEAGTVLRKAFENCRAILGVDDPLLLTARWLAQIAGGQKTPLPQVLAAGSLLSSRLLRQLAAQL